MKFLLLVVSVVGASFLLHSTHSHSKRSREDIHKEKQLRSSVCAYRGTPIFHNSSLPASSCVWASRSRLLRRRVGVDTDAAARHAKKPSLAVAICLSGEPRSFVNPSYPKHFKAALIDPLKGNDTTVDVYAHFDAQHHCREELEESVALLAPKTCVLWYGSFSHPVGGSSSGKCLANGYDMAFKWRGCLEDIELEEEIRGYKYDFVVRSRPDFEYENAVPRFDDWMNLKPNVVWTTIADGSFVDDNFAILPRAAASVYFKIADQFDKCITSNSSEITDSPCGERWGWTECRVQYALHVANFKVRRAPFHSFSWVNCQNAECHNAYRRPGGIKGKVPFLRENLMSSTFQSSSKRKSS